MEITADTPRTERTIAGRKVSVPQPFAEGQVLTPQTAAMLNQTLAENFSNNLRAKIEAGVLADGKPQDPIVALSDAEAQALVDAYAAEYQPGVRRTGSGAPRVTDPVEKEARKIARSKITEKLAAQNLKPKDVNMDDLLEKMFTKHREALMAEGKKIVRAQQAAAEKADAFNMDDIDLTPAIEEEAAAA